MEGQGAPNSLYLYRIGNTRDDKTLRQENVFTFWSMVYLSRVYFNYMPTEWCVRVECLLLLKSHFINYISTYIELNGCKKVEKKNTFLYQ